MPRCNFMRLAFALGAGGNVMKRLDPERIVRGIRPLSSPDADTESGPTYLIKSLGLRDVVSMTIVGVVSLRWISRAARMGAPSVLLWILAWIAFFIPLAAAVGALSNRYPDEGGLYAWTRRAWGSTHGYICGWCLWVNNLFYYPSLLLFAAANAPLFLGGRFEAMAASRLYSTVFVLVALWFLVGLNVLGLSRSKWLHDAGNIGMWLPAALLVIAGIVAFSRFGSATSFAAGALIPQRDALGTLSLWSALCFAFSGLEVTSLVGQEVRNPRRNIPLGVGIAGLAATLMYISGSVAVLMAIPTSTLAERTSIAEAIDLVSRRIGLEGFGAAAGLMLAFGTIATSNSWFAGAARVPFAAAMDQVFPGVFARLHPRFRTPYVVLIVQGAAASLIFLASLFLTVDGSGNSIQDAYDILVNLTILLYFVPYLYLFLSLVRLCPAARGAGPVALAPREVSVEDCEEGASSRFRIPWGRRGLWIIAGGGGLATAVSLALVFIPPPGTSSWLNYEVNLVGQAAVVLVVGLFFYRSKK